jgi:hypothetical protein
MAEKTQIDMKGAAFRPGDAFDLQVSGGRITLTKIPIEA